MFRSNAEPTIEEIMRDPTVRALMRADRVDMVKFEAKLRGLAGAIRQDPAGFAGSRGGAPGRLPPPALGNSAAAAAARDCRC